MQKGIITIATGKRPYIYMAKILGMSLKLNYPKVPVAIVTDSEDKELKELYDIIVPADLLKGHGIAQKLFMYEYSPFEETIFIDVDCMVVKPFDFLWDIFSKKEVSVIGFKRSSGNHFGASIDSIVKKFKIEDILIFNGGVYYFKKSPLAKSVFNTAKDLLKDFHKLGFSKIRESINEEPLMSIAMSLHKMQPVHDNWLGMYMPVGIKGELNIDALLNICSFQKGVTMVHPAIMHYGGTSYKMFHYKREAFKIKLAYKFKFPRKITSMAANAIFNSFYISYVFIYKLARTIIKGRPFKISPLMPYLIKE